MGPPWAIGAAGTGVIMMGIAEDCRLFQAAAKCCVGAFPERASDPVWRCGLTALQQFDHLGRADPEETDDLRSPASAPVALGADVRLRRRGPGPAGCGP